MADSSPHDSDPHIEGTPTPETAPTPSARPGPATGELQLTGGADLDDPLEGPVEEPEAWHDWFPL